MEREREKAPRPLYKKKLLRLDFQQKSGREASDVVRGTNKRVVVVKSPDPKIFDEAIFIIRDDFFQKRPDGAQRLLQEARRAANDYVRRTAAPPSRKGFSLSRPWYALAGAAAAGAAWLAVRFVGVLF